MTNSSSAELVITAIVFKKHYRQIYFICTYYNLI